MPAPRTELPKRITLGRLAIAALLAACTAGIPSAALSPAAAQSERSTRPLRTLPDAPIEQALAHPADPDVRFMTAMLAHHRQGLEMMKLAASRADSPGLRVLVGRIRSNYEDERTMITLWLRDRQVPLSTAFEGAALVAERPGTFRDPRGMRTDQQMEDLRQATGPEFDERFLRLAIVHHAVGMELVDSLLADPDAARDEAIFRIVESLQGEQSAYIDHMRRMLTVATLRNQLD